MVDSKIDLRYRSYLFQVLKHLTLLFLVLGFTPQVIGQNTDSRPNILWIYVEDISPHLGCYGYSQMHTPHIDSLVSQAVLYTQAFTTAPVCSPSRSALISGMAASTLGAHNHRSQTEVGKGSTNLEYRDSYRLPSEIRILPELFQQAGYHTAMGGKREGVANRHLGKSDYNFIWDVSMYDGDDLTKIPNGKPYFYQIHLQGGKARKPVKSIRYDSLKVDLPPYYPNRGIVRKAWAEYLNAIESLDEEVGLILKELKEKGILDNTAIFFFSDHGVSALRGKQFLYEEGVQIPLIVKYPEKYDLDGINNELISHLDIAATSLDLAGIDLPSYLQGQSLISNKYRPRGHIYMGRDRCDETVDVIRGIRTKRFKYIRNYYLNRPHAQFNQYRDSYAEVQSMRKLFEKGELSKLQERMFVQSRPIEELYDVLDDPHETKNLATRPAFKDTLSHLRNLIDKEMVETKDLGLIPEPDLESLGYSTGSKYYIIKDSPELSPFAEVWNIIKASDQGNKSELHNYLDHSNPTVRYWAATGFEKEIKIGKRNMARLNEVARNDSSPSVRVAAARALIKSGKVEQGLSILTDELTHSNALVRLYALLGIESSGSHAKKLVPILKNYQDDTYEYVRRVANRLVNKYGEGE